MKIVIHFHLDEELDVDPVCVESVYGLAGVDVDVVLIELQRKLEVLKKRQRQRHNVGRCTRLQGTDATMPRY